ncbi:MAG: metal-dependent hydrolase [Aquabacterium sp.]|nr:metal-dependent hydrolase [Aquabacterium sp.]
MHTTAASTSPTTLQSRKVQFDWAAVPLHWIPGQPLASHVLSQLHMMLPIGEFWFCKLYNQALPLITDAKLAEDVKAFIKQEAMHARAHQGAATGYLGAHGIETQSFIDRVRWLFEQGPLSDQPWGRVMPKWLYRHWLVFRLGMVAAIEHSTSSVGQYVLRNRRWDEVGADPTVLDLLRWHCAEEIEHRCVAFDLYRHLGGRYGTRWLQKLIWIPAFLLVYAQGTSHILSQDPAFGGRKPSALSPWFWLQWHRAAKAGFIPPIGWFVKEELRYLSWTYSPLEEANTQEALDYMAKSAAVTAQLG